MDLTINQYPVVMVVWLDTDVDNDESDKKEIQNPAVVITYGELVHRGDWFVSVAPECFPEADSCRHKTSIMLDNIILMRSWAGEILLDNRDRLRPILEAIGGNY